MMRQNTEAAIHIAILDYLRLALPGAVIHSSPNSFGDLSGPNVGRQVAKAKHMGMMVGWPDIEVFWHGQTMFFEVKTALGKKSDPQKRVEYALFHNGFRVVVCRSVDDALKWVGVMKGAEDCGQSVDKPVRNP